MGLTAAQRHYTHAEYIALEEASTTKHEYFDGEISAMAGGTPEHAEISLSVGATLRRLVRGRGCRVYSSDLRVRVAATGLCTYPDVSVVCGDVERDPDNASTVTNPAILVEVLSDSTEQYDREEKRAHYQQIPSLTAYLLVSQKARQIDVWSRSVASWNLASFGVGEQIALTALEGSLEVDELYEGIL